MKKSILLSIVLILSIQLWAQQTVTQVSGTPVDCHNSFYASNRQPLVSQQFIKLPTGSIKPGGWLLTQLELQKDGLNGHLGQISAWLEKSGNAWLEKEGKWGWEEVPYWLRGYGNLAYIFNDSTMIDEAKLWINAILDSQREDGNFGPYTAYASGAQDFWPNMIALWILQSYYEFSGDERVIDFMTAYFHFQLTVPDDKFLEDYWENSRGGDNLWSVVWLYNRTGDEALLKLADKIHSNTANWTKSTQLPNWHNVNIAQGVREPATYYLFNNNRQMLEASYNVQSLVRRAFGQVPGGMFGADENARIGFFDPRQGTETCGFAEQMASDEIMLLITGDQLWAENCEDIAFNSYPAAFMPDYRSLRYITAPNEVMSDSKNHNPGIDNSGPLLAMNPFSSRCCQHNHGFAWPYYTEFLMLATPDNGAAAVLFNTCQASVKVGNGQQVTIKEITDYPFDSKICFELKTSKAVQFPFYVRIPVWCTTASLTINGTKVDRSFDNGSYVCIDRKWKDGDKIELNLPMEISVRRCSVNKNSVSVDYGPLTLSLKIDERYVERDSRQTALGDSQWQHSADSGKWPSYEIYPDSPWNYALQTSAPIELVEHKKIEPNTNPFTVDHSPLVFKTKGRIVPSWTTDEYGLCGVLPYENAPKSDSPDQITLIPMGAARLRISVFPTCK